MKVATDIECTHIALSCQETILALDRALHKTRMAISQNQVPPGSMYKLSSGLARLDKSLRRAKEVAKGVIL